LSNTNRERKREKEPNFCLKYYFVIGNSIKLQNLILEREIGLVMSNNVKFGNGLIYFGAKFHTIAKSLGKKQIMTNSMFLKESSKIRKLINVF
jgi:hypothetical protein